MTYIAIICLSYSCLIISIALCGFFNMSILSVAFELGVELSFPIGEAMSGGIINTLANLFALVLVLMTTPILNVGDHIDVLICFLIFGSLLIAATILIAIAPLKLRRMNIHSISEL
jgi:hypothetical protein